MADRQAQPDELHAYTIKDARAERLGMNEKREDVIRMNIAAYTQDLVDALRRQQKALPAAIDPDCPSCAAIRLLRYAEAEERDG